MASRQNSLDKVISYFSPSTGAKRARFRAVEKIMNARAYDGASSGRRTDGWSTSGSSAVTEARLGLPRLRERSRDLVRNDPYATRAITVIPANVVGHGIVPRALASNDLEKRKYSLNWKAWAETTACDWDGLNNFYGLQNLIMRCIVENGECLIRFRPRAIGDDGLVVPLQLQVLEPDFIDTRLDGTQTSDGLFDVQGVLFDKVGKRKAYMIYEFHPGGGPFNWIGNFYKSNRIPTSEILHLFRTDRSGQVRGIPWLSPVIMKLKDFGDYSEATLVRQKIAACFTAFVQAAEQMNVLPDQTATPPLGETMEPGQIEVLKPGETVTFASPPAATGFGEFSTQQLRGIAAGLGISYEALTGDYSQVNFSSGRMGRLEMNKNMDHWQWNMMIPRLCVPVWNRWSIAATIAGVVRAPVVAEWTPPRREYIDPTKEIPALAQEVRSGFKTLPEAIRESGNDPDATLDEINETNVKLDSLGIILDTDPRKVSKTGNLNPPEADPAADGTDEGDKTSKGGNN